MDSLIKNCEAITPDKAVMFCFPFAGGGASAFYHWNDYFQEIITICPIQLPGREERILEKPYKDMKNLIHDLFRLIEPYSGHRIILFGHSMGAKLAYEIAGKLESSKRSVMRLIVSGSRVPSAAETHPLHELPDDQFIAALARFDGTPKELLGNKELLEFFLPMLRADFTMDETYSKAVHEPLSCPITAFGGTRDREADPKAVREWQYYTKSDFSCRIFEGGHFFVREREPELLNALTELLAGI